MARTEIIATGRCLPARVVKNAELERTVDTTDAWIRQRTGIEERRWVGPGENTSLLALGAARAALEKASMRAEELDAIVFATLSPDHFFPGAGCFLQARLGIPGVPALDVRDQCSGFLYGLSVADAWILAGVYRRVLLVGAKVQSPALDLTPRGRDMAVLFGDGAGAAVLGPCEDGRRVLSVHLGADGRHASDLWMEAPGSSMNPHLTEEILRAGKQHPRMEGSKVFKHAVTRMPQAVRDALLAAGVRHEELRLLIPHQANLRIAEAVQKALGLREDQVFNNIQRYGNTTAGSIPIALDEALEQGRLRRGELLAMCAFGAGFTWGSAVVRY